MGKKKKKQVTNGSDKKIDNSHWYTGDDIDLIMDSMKIDQNHNIRNYNILSARGTDDILNDIDCSKEGKYLIPVNFSNNHWVGVVLEIDSSLNITYTCIDSSSGSSGKNANIDKALNDKAQLIQGADQKKYYKQTDGFSCGPMTIENLFRYANNNKGAQDLSTEKLRTEHAALVKKHKTGNDYTLLFSGDKTNQELVSSTRAEAILKSENKLQELSEKDKQHRTKIIDELKAMMNSGEMDKVVSLLGIFQRTEITGKAADIRQAINNDNSPIAKLLLEINTYNELKFNTKESSLVDVLRDIAINHYDDVMGNQIKNAEDDLATHQKNTKALSRTDNAAHKANKNNVIKRCNTTKVDSIPNMSNGFSGSEEQQISDKLVRQLELSKIDPNNAKAKIYRGIGAQVEKDPEGFIISEVFSNSPASRNGLKAGQVITSITTDKGAIDLKNTSYLEFRKILAEENVTGIGIKGEANAVPIQASLINKKYKSGYDYEAIKVAKEETKLKKEDPGFVDAVVANIAKKSSGRAPS